MQNSEQAHALRVAFETQHCKLSPIEIERLDSDLDVLRELVDDFPVSDLHVTVIHHPRRDDYHVRITLSLPGRKLFTGERHVKIHPAYERCINKLIKKIRAHKQQMQVGADVVKLVKGPRQSIQPVAEFDVGGLIQAIENDDYIEFRQQMDVFEPALSARIARWLGKYPEIQDEADWPISVSDIVEEVFLNAFDKFDHRSHDVPPGDWLESLIDPSVQAILQSPDNEYQRIAFSNAVFPG